VRRLRTLALFPFALSALAASTPALAAGASTELPGFGLAAAEQAARLALAKDPGARDAVTLRSRVSGRFLSVQGDKTVASAPGYVFLAERSRSARGRGGLNVTRQAVLLFVAGPRQRPEVAARRDLELPQEATGGLRRASPAATLERWQLAEGSGALVLQLRWPEGGERTDRGDDTSAVYVLSGKTFREVLSIATRTVTTGSTPTASGDDTWSAETTAEVEILAQRTRGLRDIQVTVATERLSGCWHGDELGPCPPDPHPEGDGKQREAGAGAPAARELPAPSAESSRQAMEPEITRYCWSGTTYDTSACEP
jgi:hypothetical protein